MCCVYISYLCVVYEDMMYECLSATKLDIEVYVHTRHTHMHLQFKLAKEMLCWIRFEQAMFISYHANHC